LNCGASYHHLWFNQVYFFVFASFGNLQNVISNQFDTRILEKLCDDKLTNFNYLTKVNGDNTNTKTYYITIHGRLFLERGGFMYETKIQTRQTIWTIAKTTAAILNAISILAIGICGIYVSNQLNIKDIKISELEFKIDSLTKNTVKHNKTK
jgi:hypothetical protein